MDLVPAQRKKPRHDLSYHRRLYGLTPKEEKEVIGLTCMMNDGKKFCTSEGFL